jgi:hypothetical protein
MLNRDVNSGIQPLENQVSLKGPPNVHLDHKAISHGSLASPPHLLLITLAWPKLFRYTLPLHHVRKTKRSALKEGMGKAKLVRGAS